jgi:signal transduction histidine kinase
MTARVCPTPRVRSAAAGHLDRRRILSQFNIAFSLMGILPILIFCYLFTVKIVTVSLFEGLNGLYVALAVGLAILGLIAGRQAIRHLLGRVVEANAKLEQLNEQQAAFVNNVAHEFRSPLTVMAGALDNLADGLHGPLAPDQQQPIAMCQREGQRLKRLVGDLLDLARIESGKVRLVPTTVVLQDLLRHTAQLFEGLVKQRGLGLALELPEEPARIVGDQDRLQQVFVNLIGNAVKFTTAGEIHIRLSRDGEGYQVEVADTGPGIAPEDLERIFDKFERVGAQAAEGSGLGLPIAKDLIELHHGRICVESQPGQGSRFLVMLPANGAIVDVSS